MTRAATLAIFVFLVIVFVYQATINLTDLYTFNPPTEEQYSVDVALTSEVRPCEQKYIILTTQRSGSTWVCSQFDLQDEIACGGQYLPDGEYRVSELLINYSRKKEKGLADVPWSQYKKDLDRAFDNSCKHSLTRTIGFKLMYNQIPQKFMINGSLENYFQENNIYLVHLVREAQILRLASQYNWIQQEKEWGNNMHVTDSSQAEQFRNTPKMPWNDETIENVLRVEQDARNWQRSVHFMSNVRVHYLSYEKLLTEEGFRTQIAQVIAFLGPQALALPPVRINTTYYQLHDPTCSERVQEYEEFAKQEKVAMSNTVAACEMLEKHYNKKTT